MHSTPNSIRSQSDDAAESEGTPVAKATIVTGRFQLQEEADRALETLSAQGFARSGMATLFVNPAGMHATYELGGDEDVSVGAQGAALGAVGGGVAGAAIGAGIAVMALPVVGPAAAAIGLGVGAYAGSLMGAMKEADDAAEETVAESQQHRSGEVERQSGMLAATVVQGREQEEHAIRALRQLGALDIEKTEGTIVDGQWVDFDPLSLVTPVDPATAKPA